MSRISARSLLAVTAILSATACASTTVKHDAGVVTTRPWIEAPCSYGATPDNLSTGGYLRPSQLIVLDGVTKVYAIVIAERYNAALERYAAIGSQFETDAEIAFREAVIATELRALAVDDGPCFEFNVHATPFSVSSTINTQWWWRPVAKIGDGIYAVQDWWWRRQHPSVAVQLETEEEK